MKITLTPLRSQPWRATLQRIAGITFGIVTQVAFLWTVVYLFLFLRDGHTSWAPRRPFNAWSDLVLSLQFVIPHSLLLWPPCAMWIKRRLIATPFYGCFFCVATCVSLWLIFSNWTSSSTVIWDLQGALATAMVVAFYASWVALFYSLSLSGLGYQTGLTPWWYWLRRQPLPRREFVPRGAYHLLRHPIYLSFLGLIWFTPRMSLDHALLTALWTLYIFVGSYLKDERLAFYMGESYRHYESQVAGYPFIPWGPLGIRRYTSPTPSPAERPMRRQERRPLRASA